MKKILLLVLCVACVMSTCLLVSCQDNDGEGTQEGIGITYNGVRIELGAPADSIIEKLGEPNSRKEIGDCGGLGAQVKYSYASIDVFVLESKSDGNVIDGIELRDDTLTTDEGIYIGMSESSAKDRLPDAKESGGALILTKGAYSVKVKFENGAVSDIDYITES